MAALAMMRSGAGESETTDTRDTLFLLGGISLIVFGVGLVVTNPMVRKLMGGTNITGLLHGAVPDLERYLKIRSM
jgi:hypothetical protein